MTEPTKNAPPPPNPPSNLGIKALKSVGNVAFLNTSKVLDARRRGATTEAYGAIRRKPAPAKAGGGAIEGNAADDALMVYQGQWKVFDDNTKYDILIAWANRKLQVVLEPNCERSEPSSLRSLYPILSL
jgi:hypothetical protein